MQGGLRGEPLQPVRGELLLQSLLAWLPGVSSLLQTSERQGKATHTALGTTGDGGTCPVVQHSGPWLLVIAESRVAQGALLCQSCALSLSHVGGRATSKAAGAGESYSKSG